MKYVVCFCLLFVLSGCASMQVASRKAELDAQMNPLLGKTKDDIILALGAPGEIVTVGGFEIYKYFKSYGTRTQAAVAPNKYLITGNARTWESYDTINTYFKYGVMVKWDGYIQR